MMTVGGTFITSEGEKKDMSFAYVLVKKGAVYFAADSRSTTFTKSPNEYSSLKQHIDNYRKIVRVGDAIAISTGINIFNGKTLEEVAKESDSIETFKEAVKGAIFSIWKYDGGKLIRVDKNTEHFSNSSWFSGEEYAVSVVNYIPPLFSDDEKDVTEFINKLFNIVRAISDLSTETIGGPIHIGKLTPEGFSWLQNGYIL